MRIASAILLALAFCNLLAASPAHAQLSNGTGGLAGRLAITGSATLTPLITEVAARFEKLHPAVKIEVQGGGSAKGIAALRAGEADLAMVSRPLGASERDFYAFPIMRDGVAIVVNRGNPVNTITTEQLKEVLQGRITNWKALGGAAAPLTVVWRGKGSGSTEIIVDYVGIEHKEVPQSFPVVVHQAEALKVVQGDRNAMTFTSVGVVERRVKAGAPIRALAFNGIAPSSRNVRKGTYVLSRPLTLVAPRIPEGLPKQFIDYALSNHVADLAAKYDFVPYRE